MHVNVSREQCQRAGEILADIIRQG
jgi:hypothetical protein